MSRRLPGAWIVAAPSTITFQVPGNVRNIASRAATAELLTGRCPPPCQAPDRARIAANHPFGVRDRARSFLPSSHKDPVPIEGSHACNGVRTRLGGQDDLNDERAHGRRT